MKKIALAVVLGFLAQVVPTNVFASGPSNGGVVAVLAVLGVFGSDSSSSTNKDDESKSEFSKLNSYVENVDLMKQSAGGSLNTLEILK